MIFVNVPAGASVFLDSNVFVYHFSRDPKYSAPCTDLIERIFRQQLVGYSSAHVVSETAHRLMTLEAVDRFGWTYTGIAYRLQKNPSEVQSLTEFRNSIEEIPQFGVQILPISGSLVLRALEITQQTGLLHNDALIVAVMQANGQTNLASSNTDFDRVPGSRNSRPHDSAQDATRPRNPLAVGMAED